MQFELVSIRRSLPSIAKNTAFLVDDNWDDWGKFRTQFQLIVFDEAGTNFQAGDVKISHLSLREGGEIAPGVRAPEIPNAFEQLGDTYFSLGQSENYYETLNKLTPNAKRIILEALRDCAFDLSIYEASKNEPSMIDSVLRHVSDKDVRNRFHRLAHGDAKLTPFKFQYSFPVAATSIPPKLDFYVRPESNPPSNVHVLIGRNGVGKTRCMQGLAQALLGTRDQAVDPAVVGSIQPLDSEDEEWGFSGLVMVSFSAFDDFDLTILSGQRLRAVSVGLRRSPDTPDGGGVKSPGEITHDFIESLGSCRSNAREDLWREAIHALENDPLFAEADVTSLLNDQTDGWTDTASQLFKRLSSGHKIVLLTITRLIESVDERTLVLLDEPEGHLHPPLLSALIRSLGMLLRRRNGMAIIATHSPVVLQEVPAQCVWILRRAGLHAVAERPAIETFAENVGVLTREVFQLEVTSTGFHKMLEKTVEQSLTFDEVIDKFEGKIGGEGLGIARALMVQRQGMQP